MRFLRIHLLLPILAFCMVFEAQEGTLPSSATNSKVFEVVSIKPNQSGLTGGAQVLPNGEHYIDTTLELLIRGAYGMYSESQVMGMPSWAKSDRYDVDARVDAATADSWKSLARTERWKQEQPMLQAMLADRCKLKVHLETKELPAYDLVVTKGGLRMRESSPGEESSEAVRKGSVKGQAISIKNLIHAIPSDGRLILDKTGLGDKKFDFDLKWEAGTPPIGTDAGPSIFTALEEQLGLKLISSKAPASVLVVDHVEKPSPN
ncbi:MAG: TIGR03435 family protein [Acidobacteria bacterium]|nr:TIGR03435 family protein [Acidobacteriota bacterium]